METQKAGKTNNSGSSKEPRRWDVPPGGIVADGAGHLRRRRPDTYHHPWSTVPVGPKSAVQLGRGLDERDHLIMLMAERAHVITTEQVARAFFNSPVTARKRIRLLRERRFLATPEVDHRMVSRAVGHRGGTHNAPLILDWNGKYLLEHQGHELRAWDPATVAQVNSRFEHTLGVSEVWSYVVAAARVTHAYPAVRPLHPVRAEASNGKSTPNRHDACDHLAVGLLNERDSVVYNEGCTGWSVHLEKAEAHLQCASAPTRMPVDNLVSWKPRPLVKPDATLVLSITAGNAYDVKALHSYQGGWRDAQLQVIPSPADMRAAEQLGRTRFRHMFLEMETGSNSTRDMVDKIRRYTHLFRLLRVGDMMYEQSWRTLFGPTLPVILVAVRDSRQVDMQAMLWLTHFEHKAPGAVILANLEVLAHVYAMGRSHILTRPCWLDVMSQDGAKWKPLSEILGLRV